MAKGLRARQVELLPIARAGRADVKRLLSSIWIVAAVVLAARAFGAPDVTPRHFVYTIPTGFDPPLIGRSGIAEIEAAAEKLRYPYYVVLVESFDGETDDDAANYIDALAETWQRDPDFDSARSCIFVLSYSPRKYRFLAGSYWENELGFGLEAHAPFNAIFTGYVQNSRKDPKTGIIRMMQAVDRHLVTESDPKVRAARAEAQRKAEIARREAEARALERSALQLARDQLQSEINAMSGLLGADKRFLPRDISRYREAYDSAVSVLAGTDRDAMSGQAAALRVKRIDLGRYVENRREAARARSVRAAVRWGAVSASALLFLLIIVLRLVRYRRSTGSTSRKFAGVSRDAIPSTVKNSPTAGASPARQ